MDGRVRKDQYNMSLLSSHLELPRNGHLKVAALVVAYAGEKYKSRLANDSSYADIDHIVFRKYDWSGFHQDVEVATLVNATKPKGEKINIFMLVDTAHAGNKVSCRSKSCFLINVNTALAQWYSAKQSTVETSVFSVEFVAMKQGIDGLRGLKNKIRMIDIPMSSFLYSWE